MESIPRMSKVLTSMPVLAPELELAVGQQLQYPPSRHIHTHQVAFKYYGGVDRNPRRIFKSTVLYIKKTFTLNW